MAAITAGSGSELLDGPTRPAKMKALHSSSALAVNFFDAWVERDPAPLQAALSIDRDIESVCFEKKFPTGLGGNPPNLDIVLNLTDGFLIAFESKFSEWLTPKPRKKAPFKSSYFQEENGLWAAKGLLASEELARRIQRGEVSFRHLDAPQLLKHALGLAAERGQQFSLWYIYLAWKGKESELHSAEIDQFTRLVGDELAFRALTYQDLLKDLRQQSNVDRNYLDYLDARYCSPPTD
jgi:hypothetical protein